MLGLGSPFIIFPINDFNISQHNTDGSVTNLNYEAERGFTSSLESSSVLSTSVSSPSLFHSQFSSFHSSTIDFFADANGNVLLLPIETNIFDKLWL